MAGESVEVITDDDRVYRRLTSFSIQNGVVTSAAYKRDGKPDPEPSVDLARLTTPQRCLDSGGKEGLGIGVLVARAVRAKSLDVAHRPSVGNPAHCLITGKMSKQTCRKLAEATKILHQPGELKLTPARQSVQDRLMSLLSWIKGFWAT